MCPEYHQEQDIDIATIHDLGVIGDEIFHKFEF